MTKVEFWEMDLETAIVLWPCETMSAVTVIVPPVYLTLSTYR